MQVCMYVCMCYYYLGDRKTIRSFSTDSVLIVQLYVCIYFCDFYCQHFTGSASTHGWQRRNIHVRCVRRESFITCHQLTTLTRTVELRGTAAQMHQSAPHYWRQQPFQQSPPHLCMVSLVCFYVAVNDDNDDNTHNNNMFISLHHRWYAI